MSVWLSKVGLKQSVLSTVRITHMFSIITQEAVLKPRGESLRLDFVFAAPASLKKLKDSLNIVVKLRRYWVLNL